jgi:hypothetical protein
MLELGWMGGDFTISHPWEVKIRLDYFCFFRFVAPGMFCLVEDHTVN